MDWQTIVFEVIDMRSFSNLWYWISLAVMWSSASHYVMGVPFDMVTRARRHGGDQMEDLNALARINAKRLLFITHVSGIVLMASLAFVLTMLAVLGFFYDVEFAQALFLLALPITFVFSFSLATARRVVDNGLVDELLCKALVRLRIITQGIGMVSIFVTALWGMFQNLSYGLIPN